MTAKKLFDVSSICTGSSLTTMETRNYLVRGLGIERGTLTSLVGTGNTGKSILAQHLLICLSEGKPFLGFDVGTKKDGKPLRCLHIDLEQALDTTTRRYLRISKALGVSSVVERMVTNVPADQLGKEFIEFIKSQEFDFVLIDSMRKFMGGDENSSDIGSKVCTMLHRLAEECDASVMFIAHKGKNIDGTVVQSIRGTSAFYDGVDVQIDLDKLDKESDTISLTFKKMRDGKIPQSVSYVLVEGGKFNEEQNCSEELGFMVTDVPDKIDQRKIDILKRIRDAKEPLNVAALEVTVKGLSRSKLHDGMVLHDELVEKPGKRKNERLFDIGPAGLELLMLEDQKTAAAGLKEDYK